MSADDLVKVIGAVAAAAALIIAAIGALYAKLAEYHRTADGVATQLLRLTATSSRAEGRLQGQTDTANQSGGPSATT
jgi:hypothetical protein